MNFKAPLLFLILVLISTTVFSQPGYFRSPSLHDNTLVFTAEGDLWLADIETGHTQRLTTHPAEEKHASISPDGAWIAYSANYEGATEAYLIPVSGGVPERLSYENARLVVQGWTPEGEVIYASNNHKGAPGSWGLVVVDPMSLESKQLPLSDAIEGTIDAKGEYVYFVRFGLQVSSDNVRAYRGGAQGKLWRHRLGSSAEATPLAINHPGSIREPMIVGEQLYFISDASGTDNIWSLSSTGKEVTQVTNFTDWEVRSAQANNNRVVFQHGANIELMNLPNGDSETLKLNLVSDFPSLQPHWDNKPLKLLTSAQVSTHTDQVVLTARGQVAIAGNQEQRLVEVNTGADSRTRAAVLSHDGKWVYAINDSSGEHELWRYAADGSAEAKQLTNDGHVFRWRIHQSPDGQWLAHDDKSGRLFLYNTGTGKNTEIMNENIGTNQFADVVWSPDSRYLAVTRNHVDDMRARIQLYAVRNGVSEVLTSDKYESYSPAFSVDGDWLYFLSDRHFKASPGSPWGDRNTGNNFDRRTEVFAYALNENARFPFQAKNELLTKEASNKSEERVKRPTKFKAKKSDKKTLIDVEWDGLKSRLWQVPIEPGNYAKMVMNEQFIYLSDRANVPDSQPEIKSLKLEHQAKPKPFTSHVADFQLSQNGQKMMVRQVGNDNANIFIVPAAEAFPAETKDFQMVTKAWQMRLNPKDEWQQIFYDTWLMHRDSLFDPNMRGLNWQQVREKYNPMLNQVTDRYELNDLLAQMTGELNSLHSQVRGGDVPKDADSPKASTLGAQLVQSGGDVVITEIYRHDTELPSMGSPLALASVDAKAGDVIMKINGTATNTLAAVSHQLLNQAGKQVLLTLKRGKKTHQTMVTPVTLRDDNRLRYQHWVDGKKTYVKNNSSEIAYFHLYAMGAGDFANFTREFYAVYNQPGLIIDVRRNRGGNVDSLILEKLLRRNWMFWQAPRGQASGNMQQTFGGHLVVLADQFTYSDGETFTAGVKAMDLGTVIGKQTAGAGVWLSGRNRVADNGISRVAEYPVFDLNGNWVLEGHGVTPDIEVNNLPHATFLGQDAQLDAALTLLQKKLKDQPLKPFKAKGFPAVDQPAKDVKKIN